MTESQIRQKVVSTAKAWIGYNEADGDVAGDADLGAADRREKVH